MIKRIQRSGFVSEIDQFLRAYDKKHPPHDTRVKECAKFKKIYDKRDNATDKKP